MLIGPNFPQVYIKLPETGKAKLISGGSEAAPHKTTVAQSRYLRLINYGFKISLLISSSAI